MVNLLVETLRVFDTHRLDPKNIVYIGSNPNEEPPHYRCTWAEFRKLADDDYDNDFGSQQVAVDLIILFVDGTFLDRNEYDGKEWWEVNRPYNLPTGTLPIKTLFPSYGNRLGEE